MSKNNRQSAAQEIWKLQNAGEHKPYSYKTVYCRIKWDGKFMTYRFYGQQDTYSYSPVENID